MKIKSWRHGNGVENNNTSSDYVPVCAQSGRWQVTKSGDRASPGAWNNLNRSLFDLTGGEAGNNYKGCWEQSNDLKDKLKNLKLDDKWDFDRIDRGWRPTPHSWIEGGSSNPNDPHITADPWNDSFVVKY